MKHSSNPIRFFITVSLMIVTAGLAMVASAAAQSTLDPALAFGALSGAKVTLGTSSSVGGVAGAISDLILKKSAVVSSNGTSLGKKIKLDKDAKVDGTCATSGGKITLSSSATCTGGQDTSGTNPALTPLQNFASLGATACPTGGIDEGDLNLKKNGSAALTAISGINVFTYSSIKLGKAAAITITGPAGALVVINDTGDLTMGKNAGISITGTSTTANLLVVVTDSAKLDPNANIVGTLVTGKTCNLGKNAVVNGQLFCAGNLTLGSNATVAGIRLNTSVSDDVTCPG